MPDWDFGINIEAIQIDWPIEPRIISLRDRNLPMVKDWKRFEE
jgi:dTDP-4-dehydrorhamnose 3,5-epimerase-like enzyme